MFTVKYDMQSGEQRVWATEEVFVDEYGAVNFQPTANCRQHLVEEGTVYVMNHGGKTVAKIDVPSWLLKADMDRCLAQHKAQQEEAATRSERIASIQKATPEEEIK
jgi:hypothetical protein